MTIEVGQRLPAGKLTEATEFDPENGCPINPQAFDLAEATNGKKIAIFGVPGGGRADPLRSFLLAVPAAKERSDPGLHALPGGGLPGEQPVVAGNRLCHPVGQCLSPDLALGCRGRDNHCPAFLRSGERLRGCFGSSSSRS